MWLLEECRKNRNYLVYGGLEELVNYITNLKYSPAQIQLLQKGGLITNNFAKYLKTFRFSGDVHAMSEGNIFFPEEPIVRITAPLIEASLIETVIFGITVSNVLFMSKASRISSITKNVTLGMQRAHSFESGIKGLRCGHICGLSVNAWPVFVEKHHLPINRNYLVSGQHFFVKSFSDELSAFKKMVQHFPNNAAFMIDTYNIKKGIENAIIVGKGIKKRGGNLQFVTIDSGDLNILSRMTRNKLDLSGLQKVKIIAATNLDEYKLKKLVNKKAPIDVFVVATEYTTVSDSPSLEVIYKIAEIRDGKKIHYTAKLTPGKESFPGRKQVFRKYKNGKFVSDTVGLESEKHGVPQLNMIIHKGKLMKKLPSLKKIQIYFNKQLKSMPRKLLDIDSRQRYRVDVSSKLRELLNKVKKKRKITAQSYILWINCLTGVHNL
ncbi:nicotinate phosphoribosyltransferase [Patescibacteria group bacterium]|nr:nicotinate phosphoribosyltransferase [Patescibacteria group bacterium]MBU1890599.1 nicotinate phosphoribosyltransferase [Patescibacteria group bacterium]